jgi:large subunit ribosomal protein L10
MRIEKQYLTKEYVARLNASPFAVVVDYQGLTVAQFTELRRRLRASGAEAHVVKNSICGWRRRKWGCRIWGGR